MAEYGAKVRSWQVPKFSAPDSEKLSWSRQQVQDGLNFQQTSPGFEQLEESIRVLTGKPDDRLAAKQRDGRYSKLRTNRLKRNLREMINSLSDIQFTPGYHSDNNDTQSQAELMNRVSAAWYVDRFVDVKIKGAVQWMAITPRGWLEIGYRQLPGERDRAEIDCTPRSDFEVVMTGVPESGDHQEAYTVTIIKDMPMYLAHSTWPEHQDVLQPDRETPRGWIEKAKAVYESVFSDTPEKVTAKNPTVRLYYQYVLDLAINKSGSEMKMGYTMDAKGNDVETPWSYTVPSLGQPIKRGYDEMGQPVYRLAEPKDCRIFPNRRLVVFTDTDLIYDGPAYDWHGKVPLIRFCADSWVFGDFSMVHDVSSIHDTIGEIERITHQTVRNRFNPSMMYDMRALTRDKAKTFRTDLGGQRIGYNGQENPDPMKPALPQSFYTVEGWIKDFQTELEKEMDYQMGVNSISALSQMRVGAAGDTMEKMAELAGPIVKGISRDMERSMRDLAEMFKYLVFQYYTTPRIMAVVGPDGLTPENFDYDPGNLVPSHLPGERVQQPSVFSRQERARWAADHLKFMIAPNSLHSITQTSRKLMIMQMWRSGFPLDPWFLADVFGIPNFGPKPQGCNSMMERTLWWKEQEAKQAAGIQAQTAVVMARAQQAIQQGQELPIEFPPEIEKLFKTPAIPEEQGLGPNGGFRNHSGRAPTAQAVPKIAQKGDGRVYVRESE